MDNLVGFFGTVEDVENDPLQLGRVRVRVINHHDELEVEDLQWMTVGSPTTSASVNGVGTSPTWLIKGSLVYGMYFDGAARQVPVVMGSLPTIPGNDVAKHGVNEIARGTPAPAARRGPDVSGAPKYPDAKVIATPGGHVIEIDDTPSNERIVVTHTSGSYVAINKDGDVVVSSVHNMYHFVDGDANTVVDGTSTTKGNAIKIISDTKLDITAKSTCTIKSSSQIILQAPKVSIK